MPPDSSMKKEVPWVMSLSEALLAALPLANGDTLAFVGDYIECSLNYMSGGEAQNLFPDVLTLNGAGGTAVTFWASGGTTANEGVEGWVCESGIYKRSGANVIVGPLGSSDVVNGRVYVTIGYRTNNSGGAKSLLANAVNPLFWSVKNLGAPVS